MKALAGRMFRLGMQRLGLSVVRAHQTYEADRLATIQRWNIDLIIDVGANSGQYAKKLRHDGFMGKIVSLEPLPDAFGRLNDAMRADNNWQGINAAAGSYRSTAKLNVSADSVCSSLLTPSQDLLDAIPTAKIINEIDVDVVTLDSVDYPTYTAALLKLDVQGFEKQALQGAPNLLKDIKILELELGLKPGYENSYTLEYAIPSLSNMGFSLVSIGRGVSNRETGQLIDVDILLERL